jgi:hypothetical protein
MKHMSLEVDECENHDETASLQSWCHGDVGTKEKVEV